MGIVTASQSSCFYPDFGLADLQAQQGRHWAETLAWVTRLPGSDPHVMALTRTLRQIGRKSQPHSSHHNDPFCALCASEVVASFAGSEEDLLTLYYRNVHEINDSLASMRRRERIARPRAAVV